MNHIVVGFGEVGKAVRNIFDADSFDSKLNAGYASYESKYDVMHICFPYSQEFVKEVEAYKDKYRPRITIIHSSVEVGTSDKLGAVYSPVRGVHPNLEKGIRTFTKYFAGSKALEAAALFAEKDIPVRALADTRTLEAAKLWDTTAYGLMILLEKEIWDYCQKNNVEFEIVYREFTQTYNEGYTKLGMEHVVRPYLMHYPGKIGGHCVVENARLLDSHVAESIIHANEQL